MASACSTTYYVGVLTVSDRCFRGETEDKSGPYLKELISNKFVNASFILKCVPDEVEDIENTIREWVDIKNVDAIFTTGGTGFAPRDVTPEATRNVIDREAPAIPAAILYQSLSKTKLAMLSRAVCGMRQKCLIINFPGSKKAVGECLEVVIDSIPHALELLKNNMSSVTASHNILRAPVKSKVDVSKVARRARQSIFPMIEFEESLNVVRAVVGKLCLAGKVEEIPTQNALGRVLAEPALAACSLPPYRASVKDGYAAIAIDGAGPRQVTLVLVAGSQPTDGSVLLPGKCFRVNTGGPVPTGADCVVQVEDTKLLHEAEGGREELQIEVLVAPTVNQDIREIGSDIQQGTVVLGALAKLTSSQIGLLASVGMFKVPVLRLPRVAVLSTGNELQVAGRPLGPGQIWDSNKLLLMSLLKENGFPAVDLGIAEDEADETLAKLQIAMAKADVIVTTGSVSMGERDLLKHVLREDLNADIHFGRVNLKPGKPTTFASCKGTDSHTRLFFCLPGNPVSASVTAHLYVLPTLRQLAGIKQSDTLVKAQVTSDQKLDPRVEFKRGIYHLATSQEHATVDIVGGHMPSSNLLSVSTANCLVQLPANTEAITVVLKGCWVDCWLTGDL